MINEKIVADSTTCLKCIPGLEVLPILAWPLVALVVVAQRKCVLSHSRPLSPFADGEDDE